MVICLGNSRWVSIYDRAVKALGRVGITDAITLMGYYTSVSMTLAFYDVEARAPGIARETTVSNGDAAPNKGGLVPYEAAARYI